MKFWEAMRALEEGKKVRDVCWSYGCYIYWNAEKTFIHDENEDPISTDDIDITHDWEVYVPDFIDCGKTASTHLRIKECPLCHKVHLVDETSLEFTYCPYCGKKVRED